MADEDDVDHQGGGGGGGASSRTTNPAITYTRTRKTKTAASSTRRRYNIPLCHSAAASGSDESWFSRKASGWTDDEIRSHLVSGGTSKGGSLSMEGDLIQGGNKTRNGRNKNKRQLGPRFAWEEEEEEEDNDAMLISGKEKSIMRAAPRLEDIMDEEDQIALLAPQKVGKDYQSSSGGGETITNDKTRPNRQNNAALAEIAQFYDKNNGAAVIPTATTESIGWRLLRVLGYRSRLGMAFVSLPGFTGGKDDDDQANDLESMHLTKNLSAKHLASKGLRAIRLPSIDTSSNETPKQTDSHATNQTLSIPPPKINKHGIGYDPFNNAPEFRAFHEKREALAKKRGRAAENNSRSTAYFTDNLRRDERQHLWDKNGDDKGNDKMESNQPAGNQQDDQHMNYAAQDYTDFIGTKASSGFALEDGDDTNVYQDDDDGGDGFPKNNNRSGYNLEIHSPVASEDEDDGLFHNSVATSSKRNRSGLKKSGDDERNGNVADAWDVWGMGEGDPVKAVTSDGKPPLPGFQLGQQKNNGNSIKRWPGPIMVSGYVLQRHVFPADDCVKTAAAYTVKNPDSGLGLDLQPSRASVPTVLPHSEQQQQSQMRARNGTELDFNAVKESMKNRFVSSSGNGNVASTKSDIGEDTTEKEEWIDVTSTIWMPSRLLCKRWGIPLPSTAGASASTQGTKEISTTGEEAYFHETVLSKQKVGKGKRGSSIMGTKTTNKEEDNYYMVERVAGDFVGSPPNRPSEDVFKSIFDAGSDMDISSSEDEEEAQGVVEKNIASEKMDMQNSIAYEPTQADPAAQQCSDASSSPESEDARQQSRKHRHHKEDRHRRKKSHRRRSPSKSHDACDDNPSDDYDKRRRKKTHKRSHSKSRR